MELTTVWFILIAVLWIGYFTLEGFDFGVGMLLPVLARDETERRVMINTIGPVWDGNEVWVLVAGGATFAAFPEWYATLFSGFYLPLLLILVALIVRGLAFEYRHQRDEARWKRTVGPRPDRRLVRARVPLGVAFANIVHGVPIDEDKEFTGNLFTLLNPFGLLGGLVTLTLFLTHGAMFIALKTTGDIRHRARDLSVKVGLVAAVVAVVFLVWTQIDTGTVGSAVAFVLGGPRPGRRHRHGTGGSRGLGVRRDLRRRSRWRWPGCSSRLFPDVMPSLDRPGVLAHDHQRLRHRLHAEGDDLGRGRVHPDRAGLSGLDLLGVPEAARDPAHPRRRARRGLRPLDPRLLPHLRPAACPRRGAGRRASSGLLTVAQAFAVGTLVVAVVTDPASDGWRGAAWVVAWGVVLRWRRHVVRRRRRHRARPARSRRRCGIGCWAPSRLDPAGPHAADRRAGTAGRPAGLAAIEPYLTRYLPSLVLACVLPVAPLLAIFWLDWISGLIVALTLPLMPVFAVLIGTATRTGPRASGGAVRPRRALPRRRPGPSDPGRLPPSHAQSATIRAVTDRYRRATLETLRLGFASSAALELVATLSVALVAVVRGPAAGRRRRSTSGPR